MRFYAYFEIKTGAVHNNFDILRARNDAAAATVVRLFERIIRILKGLISTNHATIMGVGLMAAAVVLPQQTPATELLPLRQIRALNLVQVVGLFQILEINRL